MTCTFKSQLSWPGADLLYTGQTGVWTQQLTIATPVDLANPNDNANYVEFLDGRDTSSFSLTHLFKPLLLASNAVSYQARSQLKQNVGDDTPTVLAVLAHLTNVPFIDEEFVPNQPLDIKTSSDVQRQITTQINQNCSPATKEDMHLACKRKEDDLLAESMTYVELGHNINDDVHFPMANAGYQGMKVVRAFMQSTQNKHFPKVKQFIVSGASKRGWAALLSTDVDQLLNAPSQRQVMALIPILMPIDFPEVFNVENQYFGGTPRAFNPNFPSGINPYENDSQLKDANGNFLHRDILDQMVSI